MIRILDKGILFGLGAVLLFQRQDFVIPVVVLLTALIFSSFSLYLTAIRTKNTTLCLRMQKFLEFCGWGIWCCV